jgi:hypothetical protein
VILGFFLKINYLIRKALDVCKKSIEILSIENDNLYIKKRNVKNNNKNKNINEENIKNNNEEKINIKNNNEEEKYNNEEKEDFVKIIKRKKIKQIKINLNKEKFIKNDNNINIKKRKLNIINDIDENENENIKNKKLKIEDSFESTEISSNSNFSFDNYNTDNKYFNNEKKINIENLNFNNYLNYNKNNKNNENNSNSENSNYNSSNNSILNSNSSENIKNSENNNIKTIKRKKNNNIEIKNNIIENNNNNNNNIRIKKEEEIDNVIIKNNDLINAKVTIKHMKMAYDQLFLSEIYPISELPDIEKYFIVSIYKSKSNTKDEFINFELILSKVESQLKKKGYNFINTCDLIKIFETIVKLNLIEIKNGNIFSKVKLKIDETTIKNELSDIISIFENND